MPLRPERASCLVHTRADSDKRSDLSVESCESLLRHLPILRRVSISLDEVKALLASNDGADDSDELEGSTDDAQEYVLRSESASYARKLQIR